MVEVVFGGSYWGGLLKALLLVWGTSLLLLGGLTFLHYVKATFRIVRLEEIERMRGGAES